MFTENTRFQGPWSFYQGFGSNRPTRNTPKSHQCFENIFNFLKND